MPTSIGNLDWGSWAYGLIYAFIAAGASSLNTALGALIADPKDFNLESPRKLFTLMACSFLLPGMVAFFAKLSQSPLPTVRVTQETTIMQTNPPAIVKTTVETMEKKPQ